MRIYFFLLTGLLFLSPSAWSATRIDLVLDEVQARSVPWPITTGVPFPRGKLTSVDRCRLIDDLGIEYPLQAKKAATWDGPDGSIRWLTIDFIATPGRKFALEFGDDVTAKQFASPIVIDRRGNFLIGSQLTLDTGAIKL